MKEELITLETAKLAKKVSFDIPVFYYYAIVEGRDPCEEDKKQGYSGSDIPRKNWNTSNKDDNWVELISSPTQSLLQRWLREEYNIHVYCILGVAEKYYYIIHNRNYAHGTDIESKLFDTYEEALEFGLQEALKIIK